MKTFEIDAKRMNEAIKKCGGCNTCYVEQIWREIGDCNNNHCGRTKRAFYGALSYALSVHKVDVNNLPDKDTRVCIKRKDGKYIYARLFYDEEGKPCMFYDDFDNWYSINDVELWKIIFENDITKLTIKIEE